MGIKSSKSQNEQKRENQKQEDQKNSEIMMQNHSHKSKYSQNDVSKNKGISAVLKSTLRKNKLQQPERSTEKRSEQVNQNPSKNRNLFHFRLRNNKISCEICGIAAKIDQRLCLCQCQHKLKFCESCLHHYVIYKVKMFQEVYCPSEGCEMLLNVEGQFFKQLPADIQKRYRKLHNFYAISKDSSKKLCPRQNCEGFIDIKEETMVCHICKCQFCPNCLLFRHEGQCEKHEVEFFHSNLHYRQCKNCKFIIEKNQGCNHMTCRCGYQFCYICSADWTPDHYRKHDENANLIAELEPVAEQRDRWCDCECLEGYPVVAFIVKLPFKLVIYIIYISFLVMMFCLPDLIILIVVTLITLFAGMFGFFFQLISDMNGLAFILSIVFFPIFMIQGVGVAFQEIFCVVMTNLISYHCEIVKNGMTAISEI